MEDNVLMSIAVMRNGDAYGTLRGEKIISGHWDSVLDALDIVSERITDRILSEDPQVGDKVQCDIFNPQMIGTLVAKTTAGFVIVKYPDGTACLVNAESVIIV